MGMFSWDCNACGFAMRDCRNCAKDGWMGHAVCLTPDGSRVIGQYDHYGSLGSYSLVDHSGPFAIYHKACWELAGKPEYDRPARHSRDQGGCLAIHGQPLPKPTSPEWFTVARTWEAVERVLRRYAKLRSDIESADVERLWTSLTPEHQIALCAEFEADQQARNDRYRAAYNAWFDGEGEGADIDTPMAPMPEPEKAPKSYTFNGLVFNYGWLDVFVSKANDKAVQR
jgi:hypothetical protein